MNISKLFYKQYGKNDAGNLQEVSNRLQLPQCQMYEYVDAMCARKD